MKPQAILLVILAVVYGYSEVKTWTFAEIAAALANNSDPHLTSFFGYALNQMTLAVLYNVDNSMDEYEVVVLSPSGELTWTIKELVYILEDPKMGVDFMSIGLKSDKSLKKSINAGNEQDTIVLTVPAVDISLWNIQDVIDALQDNKINAELVPHLKTAHDVLAKTHQNGSKKESKVGMVTRVGLIPHLEGSKYVLRSSLPMATRRFIKDKTKLLSGIK